MLTGIYVPHSTQHRLLERYKLAELETTEKVEALSIDGGNVRLTLLCHFRQRKSRNQGETGI